MPHQDALAALNQNISLREKLSTAHAAVQKTFPFIARIAIALYDPETHILKTYLHSSGDDNPLENYETLLENAPSLKQILAEGRPRVINNMLTFDNVRHEHTKRLGRQGYAASYTLPIFQSGIFLGFIFFNSYETDVFSERVLHEIDLYGHLIAMMIVNELTSIKTLSAALRTTSQLTHIRDPETGSHLDRMSRYSRLIAMELAKTHRLNDDYIEHLFMFAPLHDIGKIGIPDSILLKPGPLTDEERAVMQTHTRLGREIIDKLLNNFSLDGLHHADILRNIAECHHEAVNGSGYPHGKRDQEIPLEARIVAVADVFDALTSRRPYKEAWSNAEAFARLDQLAGDTLDRECVSALFSKQEEVEAIQQQFREDVYG
ncbi:MAG: HD domain-containing protein [Gammaproteobacteria bacterium]|nr:HD domain-containing protein [Gammaproteobacteria bacterium]